MRFILSPSLIHWSNLVRLGRLRRAFSSEGPSYLWSVVLRIRRLVGCRQLIRAPLRRQKALRAVACSWLVPIRLASRTPLLFVFHLSRRLVQSPP